ncbi:ATP-binding protein [Xanthocytophaga agilis]|uniref:Sensory/regulatory protein RpfC n=1 Tax=Xanthocytophaga agilis TaxID=3048010 RepID=A0AAE3UEL6_9BACT|nr:ATP-binding protein [Xanthocytophaga agilis]MDJ1502365.1 ATP-binding protein [Xanthocytophaga agilis]
MEFLYNSNSIDVDLLFPFFFEMDQSLIIKKSGKSLQKINSQVASCPLFSACFHIQRPWSAKYTFESILEYSSQIFILTESTKGLTLRGQFIFLNKSHTLLFIGTPWLTSTDQLAQYSLSVPDFALSDSFTDMIQFLKIHEINTSEIRSLANNLKEQKQIIEQKELLFRQLVENATDIIFRYNTQGTITYINPATEDITGYTAEEIIGQKIQYVVSPSFKEEVIRIFLDQIHRQLPKVSFDYTFTHKDGRQRWLSQNSIAIFENNQIVGITAVARDITYKKEAEEELLLSRQKALELAATKERFLANTSHEIRTPMNAIIGLSDLLRETPLTEKQQEYVHSIHTSAENLLVIINDILDLSKIGAGRLELEHIDFDLNEKLSSLIRSLQIKASEKNITLSSSIDHHINKYIKGDPYRLNQILMNLLSNAIKFTDHGRITLTATLLEELSSHQIIRFSVEDTGIGISSDKLFSIFEDFTQADTSTTRKYGGTGLGLSICKKLSELMEGSLDVSSTPGKGSIFTLTVTLEKGVEITANKESIHEANSDFLSGKSVLLVEDNEFNQLLAITILQQWNTKVTLVPDGLAAIAEVRKQEFDIILMDIQMPVMGGIEATEIIRKDLCITTPIIALTADAIVENIKEYLDKGMNACVTKPFQRDNLFKVMYDLLSNKALTKVNSRMI